MAKANTSPRFKLDKVDAYKSARGFLITLVGSTIAFVSGIYLGLDYVVTIKGVAYDLSTYVVPFVGVVLEIGRRWVTKNSPLSD